MKSVRPLVVCLEEFFKCSICHRGLWGPQVGLNLVLMHEYLNLVFVQSSSSDPVSFLKPPLRCKRL
jgi:hypothetical protein